jgi:hypothetical protein
MAAFNEYSDRPDPPHTTQSADFRSSYREANSLFLTLSRFSLILLMYPMRLTLLLI